MTHKLTDDQKRILIRLCDAAERHHSVRLICEKNGASKPIRETATGAALVRKGLARRLPNGRFEATDEGFWMGDTLRIEARS